MLSIKPVENDPSMSEVSMSGSGSEIFNNLCNLTRAVTTNLLAACDDKEEREKFAFGLFKALSQAVKDGLEKANHNATMKVEICPEGKPKNDNDTE